MSLDQQLDQLSALKDGWDGYDGSPVSKAALETARFLSFSPYGDGSLQIELHAGGVELEIVLDVNGQVEEVTVEWKRPSH